MVLLSAGAVGGCVGAPPVSMGSGGIGPGGSGGIGSLGNGGAERDCKAG